jgi:hypothetical protein
MLLRQVYFYESPLTFLAEPAVSFVFQDHLFK